MIGCNRNNRFLFCLFLLKYIESIYRLHFSSLPLQVFKVTVVRHFMCATCFLLDACLAPCLFFFCSYGLIFDFGCPFWGDLFSSGWSVFWWWRFQWCRIHSHWRRWYRTRIFGSHMCSIHCFCSFLINNSIRIHHTRPISVKQMQIYYYLFFTISTELFDWK